MAEADKKREELLQLLQRHDWYYDRSDDWNEYTRGRRHYETITALMKEVPDGTELYKTFYNKAYPNGG